MTYIEFEKFTTAYNNIWLNSKLDAVAEKYWFEILKDFEVRTLLKAIKEIATAEEYPPTIRCIIEGYQSVRKREYIQQQYKPVLIDKRRQYCYLCRNSGLSEYIENKNGTDYTYSARCICPRGNDLNKFSKSQLDNQNINYRKNIKEALREDFIIYEAEAKLKYEEILKEAECLSKSEWFGTEEGHLKKASEIFKK